MFPRFATFKEGTKLNYGCVFYFPASVTPYARYAKRLNQDLGSIRRSLGEVIFSIAKVWLLSGGRALETLVKQHEEMSLFVKHAADKQHFPVFL